MFETLGLGITPQAASVWFGLALGLVFGAAAQVTRFCLRRALVGPARERAAARGVWAMALAVAVLGTQGAVALGLVSFQAHRFGAATVPVASVLLGGLMFGFGTVMARGCLSRLTVLSAGGNLRALIAVVVAGLVAQATLLGPLAPMRMALGALAVPMGGVAGMGWLWAAVIAGLALWVVIVSRPRLAEVLGGALIGALVPVAWVGTGFVLYDPFDPIALEGLAFTGPWADALFWATAAQLATPGFGTGLVGGVLMGALVAAVGRRQFRIEGFANAAQTGQSLGGAALMGLGGVLAGGCTVGAGLAGVPTLGASAIIAFGAVVAGVFIGDAVLARRGLGRGLVAAA